MRSSIAAYKESLSRIANEVLDAAEELEPPLSRTSSADGAVNADRRASRRLSHSRSPTTSPIPNGTGYASPDEIAQYKADIQKLQASEAEIKALSFNYASMLKEKEEQLNRLREENNSLRKTAEEKNVGAPIIRDGGPRSISNYFGMVKGRTDMSPGGLHRNPNQVNLRSTGTPKGSFSKQDSFINGSMQPTQFNAFQKIDQRIVNSQGIEEELSLHEGNNRSLMTSRDDIKYEIEELKAQLVKEREDFKNVKVKLQEEHQLNESFRKELYGLKMDKEKASAEVSGLQKELNENISKLTYLQMELDRRSTDKVTHETIESLKTMIAKLEKENAALKVEKDEMNENLEQLKRSMQEKADACNSDPLNSQKLDEVTLNAKEEIELMIQQLEKSLNKACKERDKASQELARLKQHLLEQEIEESNKMDEDNKIIEELRSNSEYQRTQILQLEMALKQEMAKRVEINRSKSEELHKLNELIHALKEKVATCMNTIDAKNVELLNLQTALGQYYAETEAKERLGRDLASTREESAKLSQTLKVANEKMEILGKEKADINSRLSQTERLLSENKYSITKLEEENSKLRRALEKSMTTLNRMSLDSDNYVDRRIVIKLLVTYFQRNHSKEVLDLMVRMLGFSEEEKQRIGLAQQGAGKGVVRGVLGLPGRLVGGIIGGSSHETPSGSSSDNQSFADLWVDFLLKENEERERRESADAARAASTTQSPSKSTPVPNQRTHPPPFQTSSYPSVHSSGSRFTTLPANPNRTSEQPESEFATVPLNTSVSPLSDYNSKFSRQQLPRY
ncbi:GRIP domain-containing protein [Dioscorea alata]|uniref:GRIP domain-containing protein n=1 Tax=Dioscorea alata TaxID=55571 RepID=A0ACB7UD75_DIOAL|nr:GRIP domain-containing protein [Dioscorea alata]